MTNYFHPSAYVNPKAILGNDINIWHFSHVREGAKLGDNVTLGQNVYVSSRASIGSNSKVQNNVSIFDEVCLEENVFCGPSVCFTNVYNPRAKIERKSEYKATLIKQGATLGANSTIVCGVIIGRYAFVGAGSVVISNVEDYSLVVGNPAKPIGWMSEEGHRLDLPLTGTASTVCNFSGDKYKLEGEKVIKVD